MKTRIILGWFGAAVLAVEAGQPLPPAIIYGQVRNEHGYPMDSGGEVAVLDLSNGSNECGTYELDGDIHIGINYRISIPLEDRTPLSRPNATLPGSNGKVVVRVDGEVQDSVPSGDFVIPASGEVLRLDILLAEDVDGDGLPDAWEELMVAWSGGLFGSIEDIDPDEDPDGDGMTTYEEFLAGTFPHLATDVFKITQSEPDPDTGRIALTFFTSSSKTYHILVSGALSEGDWVQAAASETDTGLLEYQPFAGTGRSMTVYVDGVLESAFFRAGVN